MEGEILLRLSSNLPKLDIIVKEFNKNGRKRIATLIGRLVMEEEFKQIPCPHFSYEHQEGIARLLHV